MNIPVIILGSGASVKYQSTWCELLPMLMDRAVFGLNNASIYYKPTIHLGTDWFWYKNNKAFADELAKWSIVFGKQSNMFFHNKIELSKDIYWIKCKKELTNNPFQSGFVGYVLSGSFAIHIAHALGFRTVFLLGFDGNATNGETHWYNDLTKEYDNPEVIKEKMCGIGLKEDGKYKTDIYNDQTKLNENFAVLSQLADIKIYNVNPQSAINIFEKIDYSKFYSMIEATQPVNQIEVISELRSIIETKINEK